MYSFSQVFIHCCRCRCCCSHSSHTSLFLLSLTRVLSRLFIFIISILQLVYFLSLEPPECRIQDPSISFSISNVFCSQNNNRHVIELSTLHFKLEKTSKALFRINHFLNQNSPPLYRTLASRSVFASIFYLNLKPSISILPISFICLCFRLTLGYIIFKQNFVISCLSIF